MSCVLKPVSICHSDYAIFLLDLVVDRLYLFFPVIIITRYSTRVPEFVVFSVLAVDVVALSLFWIFYFPTFRKLTSLRKNL